MKPTVGRIVHARHRDSRRCYAAIIVSVWEGSDNVGLCVLLPHGMVFPGPAREEPPVSSPSISEYEWHWPERVEE